MYELDLDRRNEPDIVSQLFSNQIFSHLPPYCMVPYLLATRMSDWLKVVTEVYIVW